MGMAHVAVAGHAQHHFLLRGGGKHLVNRFGVAGHTGGLGYPPVAGFDFDGVGIVTGGEGQGVEETVVGFGDPFAHRMMRQVAIVADGDVMVARVLPGIVILLHYMAVHAGRGIVAQVAGSLAITKSEQTQTSGQSERTGDGEIIDPPRYE